ncbi:methylamine utilization protein MauJ [Sphingopyxis sp.]|uniref:methylamine utilization protein MauJ n=1 Tax=Sphingopyxis sp. TaxID=1908224 RepID=UPI003D6D868B
MLTLQIPLLAEALVGEIAEAGDWIIANLETSISWPVAYQRQEYAGRTYFIIPLTKDHCPAVAIRRGDDTLQESRSSLLRFLSAMSWTQSAGAIVQSFSGGGLPRPQRRGSDWGLSITPDLNLTYLPEPEDPRSALALALMREGRGLNHPAYAFLSFYRVLEAAIPAGKDRQNWVDENIDEIMDHGGRSALERLRASGVDDPGAHLYKSGRMAIAHAQSDPIINPDDASDYDRIAGELPIMRGLAELAIERILGVKTRSTIYREHLYELRGFKERLGAAAVASISTGAPPADGAEIDMPSIDVELRRKEPYPPLHAMTPVHAQQVGSSLVAVFKSQDEIIELTLTLDFADERLRFDWAKDIDGHDDGSSLAAADAATLSRFLLEYIGNGELHIYESETRVLLGRVEAFLPNNYFANHDGMNARIKAWEAEADKRRAAGH